MDLPYLELHYASTQQSLLTGADGFGVRTYTQGMPTEFAEHLKDRDVFLYEGGAQPLAGISELLENPKQVLDYPKSYSFFKEEIQKKIYYVFTRTIFLGRDYGWYLVGKDESARSGNVYCHAIFFLAENFRAADPTAVFQTLVGYFKPRNFTNVSDNLELRQLLTNEQGPPSLLPRNRFLKNLKKTPVSALSNVEKSLVMIYAAFESNRKIVIVQDSKKTEQHLLNVFAFLPRFMVNAISFTSNYHSFNLVTDNTILFLNENFQRALPNTHPQLYVCDYLRENFSALPPSEFADHVTELMQTGQLESLKKLIAGFDRMIDCFRDDISFNELFFAWQHLLNTDAQSYEFEPLEVIKKIKGYPLRKEFRSQLENHTLDSFAKALEEKQHRKIARSLSLLMDINPATDRWKMTREAFSNYFLTEDNATHLCQEGVSNELVLKVLKLTDKEEGVVDFISNNKLPSETMSFFVRNFCMVLPRETVEIVIYMAAVGKKIDTGFSKDAIREWGTKSYFLFLEKHDFFVFMGEQLQFDFFGVDTITYLKNLLQTGDPLAFIKNKITVASFFHRYFDSLIKPAKTAEVSLAFNINMLYTYAGFVSDKLRHLGEDEPFTPLLITILQKSQWATYQDVANKLIDICIRFKKLLKEETNDNSARIDEEAYQQSIEEKKKSLAFIHTVIKSRSDILTFTELDLPFGNLRELNDALLNFTLAILPLQHWLEKEPTEMLLLYFAVNEGFRRRRINLSEQSLDIITYIPFYYQHYVSEIEGVNEDYLIDFHCTYIEVLWGLRPKSRKESEDASKIDLHVIKIKVVKILNNLLAVDRRACKEVIDYIEHEMPDRDTDFIDHIKEHVQSGSTITNFFKKVSSVLKKK